MARLCHALLIILGLHCLTLVLAGGAAWPRENGSIVRCILLPELSFWQGVLPNGSAWEHTPKPPKPPGTSFIIRHVSHASVSCAFPASEAP